MNKPSTNNQKSYTNIMKNEPKINFEQILKFLTELLTTIAITDNPKSLTISTVKNLQ